MLNFFVLLGYKVERNITVVAGKSSRVRLRCPSPLYVPVAWYRGRKRLKFSEKITFPDFESVYILGISGEDRGTYICEVPGQAGLFRGAFHISVTGKSRESLHEESICLRLQRRRRSTIWSKR